MVFGKRENREKWKLERRKNMWGSLKIYSTKLERKPSGKLVGSKFIKLREKINYIKILI